MQAYRTEAAARSTPHRPHRNRQSKIPNPRTANALAVCDGQETVGFLVTQDGSHWAFDADSALIGEYPTRSAALRAIPARGVS